MHPEIARRIIQKYARNSTDVVLDPFMGSGTSAVVAKQLKRNFVGYEINKEYIDITKKRLQNVI